MAKKLIASSDLQLLRVAFEQTTQKELELFLKVPRQESLLWS